MIKNHHKCGEIILLKGSKLLTKYSLQDIKKQLQIFLEVLLKLTVLGDPPVLNNP